MAKSQTKEDKAQFFFDLEQLCESDSDSEVKQRSVDFSHRSIVNDSGLQSLYVSESTTRQTKKACHREPEGATVTQGPSSRMDSAASHPKILSPAVTCQEKAHPKQHTSTPTNSTSMKRTRSSKLDDSTRSTAKKFKGDAQTVPREKRMFDDLVFFFIPNDDVAKPRRLRIQKATEHGAQRVTKFGVTVTHVIVEPHINYTQAAKAFPDRRIPEDAVLLKTTWLTESLGSMFLHDVSQSRFQVDGAPPLPGARGPPVSPQPISHGSLDTSQPLGTPPPKRQPFVQHSESELEKLIAQVKKAGPLPLDSDSEESASFSSTVSETSFESASSLDDINQQKQPPRENVGFSCMNPHEGKNGDNPNSRTINILQEMATYYDRTGDHWRTTAYRKAITALGKQKKLIATREQAIAIPQIGARLADKIEEIVVTNRLRRLENAKDDPHAETVQLFMGIYDVGPKQASQWIAQGHRTLSDLLEYAKLSSNQRIGIAHYNDFLQRIPREEVKQHASIMQRACRAVDKDIQVIIGGSYRRGNTDSGDIDLLITKPNADMSHIRTLLTTHIIPSLTSSNFLKCALISSHSTGSKWHGASCLPASTTWRRIDLLFVPWEELGAALLYFTGNDIFNRSMRLLASKKKMRLNQHGLYKDVMRGKGRVKVTEGTLLEGSNERRIFEILGVPWREPWERKC